MHIGKKWVARIVSVVGAVGAASAFGATLVPIASFTGSNGQYPKAGLIFDSAGNLFGTTELGGANSAGTIFEIAKNTTTIKSLASFNGASMGGLPLGGLIFDHSGNLYGTAEGNGASGNGTIFKLAAGSSTITALASFNGTNGAHPYAGLVMDGSGALFGTTELGGGSGAGNVFKLPAQSGTVSPVASCDGNLLGSGPQSPVIMDAAGNLYGTTGNGGSSGNGLVFKIAAGTSTITPLASFSGANGANPYGGLIEDSAGNLFGTAANGGANLGGVVFEVPAGSNSIVDVADFNGTNGSSPQAALIEDAAGNFFGTTFNGGANDDGVVFELPAGSHTIKALVSFNGTNGQYPYDSLVADSAGNLYGTTFFGGSSSDGNVFEVTGSGFVAGPEPGSAGLIAFAVTLVVRRRGRE